MEEYNLHSVISYKEMVGLTEACNMIHSLDRAASRLATSRPDTALLIRKLANEEIEAMENYLNRVKYEAEELLAAQEEARRLAIADGDGLLVEGPRLDEVATSAPSDSGGSGGSPGPGQVYEVRDIEEATTDPESLREDQG